MGIALGVENIIMARIEYDDPEAEKTYQDNHADTRLAANMSPANDNSNVRALPIEPGSNAGYPETSPISQLRGAGYPSNVSVAPLSLFKSYNDSLHRRR